MLFNFSKQSDFVHLFSRNQHELKAIKLTITLRTNLS